MQELKFEMVNGPEKVLESLPCGYCNQPPHLTYMLLIGMEQEVEKPEETLFHKEQRKSYYEVGSSSKPEIKVLFTHVR